MATQAALIPPTTRDLDAADDRVRDALVAVMEMGADLRGARAADKMARAELDAALAAWKALRDLADVS